MNFGKWVGFLALVVSLYILWQIRQVLLLGLTAVVLATAVNQLVRRFQKAGVNRAGAVALSVGILLAFLVGFGWLVVPPFIDQFQQLIQLVPLGLDRLRSWVGWIENRLPGETSQYIPEVNDLFAQLQPIATRLFGNFFAIFSNTLTILLNVLLVVVLTIMLLVNPSAYQDAFIKLFPSFYRRRAAYILSECEVALAGWLKGILFNMTVIAVMSWVGLLILSVPLPLANSLVAGLLTFIPNVGPTLSVIPPMAIALLDAPWKAVGVLILYVLIQQIESNILTPAVMEKQVSLLPAVTLLSQLVFAVFFGFLGLFLALPLVVIGQVWLKEVLIHDVLDHWQGRSPHQFESEQAEPPAPLIKSASEQSLPPRSKPEGSQEQESSS